VKKISTLFVLLTLVSPSLWADNYSYSNQRSWTAAISTWPLNGFISKDFFATDSGLGISTTSRINYSHPLENWSAYSNYYKTISLEQTANLDLLLGWFHLQLQVGPSFSYYQIDEENTATWKWSKVGFMLGTNLIISQRAFLSVQVRTMPISEEETLGSGGIYLGWRF
jgi:hypothetical protein